MIQYYKATLRIAELWFDEESDGVRADIIRHMQCSIPIEQARCWNFHTILIDLNRDADLLLERIKKDTRYEIRRAMNKDILKYQLWTAVGPGLLDQFRLTYDQFAMQKGLPRKISARLTKLASVGRLALSQVRNEQGVPLVWHTYYMAKNRVRLLHSVSLDHDGDSSQRSLLGRANRYHHWEDILAFKAKAIGAYDFGGWYGGGKDQKKLSINKFKEEFGGEVVLNYNCQSGITLAGKVAVWLYARIKPEHSS